MEKLLNVLKNEYELYKEEKGLNSSVFFDEIRYVERVLKEIEWERMSHHGKQEYRKIILSKLKRAKKNDSNFNYDGYEEKLIKEYDSLIKVKKELINNNNLKSNKFLKNRLLGMILVEIRAIDKSPRMKNISHVNSAVFVKLIKLILENDSITKLKILESSIDEVWQILNKRLGN